MIVKEQYIDEFGIELCRIYSDSNHYIKKVGTNERYQIAVDLAINHFDYEEMEDTFEDSNADGSL